VRRIPAPVAEMPPSPLDVGLPGEWVVVAPADGQTVYRLVGAEPLKIRDFQSDRDKKRPRWDEDLEVDHLGLSVFATLDQAQSMARRYPKIVAEVELTTGGGIAIARTIPDLIGHYTIWGCPEDLLERVSSVVRQDQD
jgi:hypothetical protein